MDNQLDSILETLKKRAYGDNTFTKLGRIVLYETKGMQSIEFDGFEAQLFTNGGAGDGWTIKLKIESLQAFNFDEWVQGIKEEIGKLEPFKVWVDGKVFHEYSEKCDKKVKVNEADLSLFISELIIHGEKFGSPMNNEAKKNTVENFKKLLKGQVEIEEEFPF